MSYLALRCSIHLRKISQKCSTLLIVLRNPIAFDDTKSFSVYKQEMSKISNTGNSKSERLNMTSIHSLVKEIGENYKSQWNLLLNTQIDIKNKNSYVQFKKKKICIKKSSEIEKYLVLQFDESDVNIFELHLSL